eukprot:jgi/Hompol1/2277/HPOL_002147-RA
MLVAFALISVVAAGLSISFVELSILYPFSSGCSAYTYAAFGGIPATIIGYCYTLSFIVGSTITTIAGTSPTLEPLWWILLFTFIAVINYWPEYFLIFNMTMAIISVLILISFLGIELSVFNMQNIWNTVMPDGSISTAALPLGFTGVLNAMPSAAFLYIGFEGMPVLAEETTGHDTSTPRGMLMSMLSIALAGILTLIITPSSSIPITVLPESGLPHLDLIVAILCPSGANTQQISVLFAALHLPALVVCIQSITFLSTRYIYALARGGYLPTVLAITTEKTQSPLYSVLATSVLTILVTAIIKYGSASATQILSNIQLPFAFLAYTIDAIVFIYLIFMRQKQFMDVFAKRWPTFILCVSAICISVMSLLGLVILQSLFLYSLLAIVALIVVIVPYYMLLISSNLKASPERE